MTIQVQRSSSVTDGLGLGLGLGNYETSGRANTEIAHRKLCALVANVYLP